MMSHYEYVEKELRRSDLDKDPFVQFSKWMQEAESASIFQANGMILATVDPESKPYQRALLLKRVDEQGFVFFTNLESKKAQHMQGNENVSLHFLWMIMHRQVAINGTVKKLSVAENVKYFATRPRGSQIGAWASRQSQILSSRQILQEKYAELRRKFAAGEVPLPSFWGGYRVEPTQFEFWQGCEHRLHDRFLYKRTGERDWLIERLSP